MNIYFPLYYKKFRCIADKCKHSCCVGWEIGIDEETMHKFDYMTGELGDEVRSHICKDESVIRLLDNGRCPFLDERGLCRIISAVGESCVSVICREHPRFYHSVCGRIEGGLGAVCEEACRIILSSDDFSDFVAVDSMAEPAWETDYDSLSHREYLFSILRDNNYSAAFEIIKEKYNLHSVFDGGIDWQGVFGSLEYLDGECATKFNIGNKPATGEEEEFLRRFLAYLIFRHVSIADNYEDLRARVGFCLLLSYVFENSLSDIDVNLESAANVAVKISEEIEYSEDNTQSLIMEITSVI